MTPQTIPWLLCGALCIMPLLIGTLAFFAWSQFTNRIPTRDVSEFTDEDGRKHVVTEWAMLTRQERKAAKEPEVKE
jgi:hypothetical protein